MKLLERIVEVADVRTGERVVEVGPGVGVLTAQLLAAGADPNAIGADRGTPLHWACHHDNAQAIELILDAGADPEVANRWGRTPLHVAARRGCTAVAALLISRVSSQAGAPLQLAL